MSAVLPNKRCLFRRKSDEIALVAGSFDPITVGHEWVLRQALRRYKTVYLVGFINPDKKYLFWDEDRLRFLQRTADRYPGVIADQNSGYLADYCREKGITVVVKGYRSKKDYDYELSMAEENNRRNPALRTLLLLSPRRLRKVSSTRVRETLIAGGSLKGFVPAACRGAVAHTYTDFYASSPYFHPEDYLGDSSRNN